MFEIILFNADKILFIYNVPLLLKQIIHIYLVGCYMDSDSGKRQTNL